MNENTSPKCLKSKSQVPVVILVFVSLIIIVNICALTANISLKELYDLLLKDLFYPDRNVIYFILPGINYAYFGLFLLTVIVSYLILKRQVKIRKIAFTSCLLTLILSIGIQTSTHIHFFKKEFKENHGRTLDDRIAQFSIVTYRFAQYCHHYLPGKHNCEFISDRDFTTEKYMALYVHLRSYLYPIDIHFNRSAPKDCAILFWKEDAINHVPDGFEPVRAFSPMHLIAIKKK